MSGRLLTPHAMNTPPPDSHPDPITGEPGSHPLGTGLGAAGAGAAGAAIGAMAGPLGAAVGAVAGAVAGGLFGSGVAEGYDPSVEEAYWKENHAQASYIDPTLTYEDYAPAYRLGYETAGAQRGNSYTTAEETLMRSWENIKGESRLSWEKAKHATRAAWERVERPRPPIT